MDEIIKRGTPVVCLPESDYEGLTAKVTHFHGDPGYATDDPENEVWIEFDDPDAAESCPFGGVWVNVKHDIKSLAHDGDLGNGKKVWYDEGFFEERYDDFVDGISISHRHGNVNLTYEEALSLLGWLKQEEVTLKEKANKEP